MNDAVRDDGRGRREGLQVFIRIRPPLHDTSNCVTSSSTSLKVLTDKHDVTCSYDHIFGEFATQQDVFQRVQPTLSAVLQGINGSVLAYGQTSAGKSFTMLGPEGGQEVLRSRADKWGILPRAADYLLGTLAELAEDGLCTYVVKASFLQIYNESLHDLLGSRTNLVSEADSDKDKDKDKSGREHQFGQPGLKIREVPVLSDDDAAYSNNAKASTFATGPQEVYVTGLSEYRVHTAGDVLDLLRRGTDARTTAATEFNATSSRSHAVLQLQFEITLSGAVAHRSSSSNTKDQLAAYYSSRGKAILRAKLSLVDLAGSEKMSTGTTGIPSLPGAITEAVASMHEHKHVRELSSINKSLSALGNVIAALGSGKPHVPYRDSKLTRLLQDSLGGNTRTVVIACVSPTVAHSAETINTLSFADRARSVMSKVRANVVAPCSYEGLRAALERANAEISRLRGLLKRSGSHSDSSSILGGNAGSSSEQESVIRALRNENAALRARLEGMGCSLPDSSVSSSHPNMNASGRHDKFEDAAEAPARRRKKVREPRTLLERSPYVANPYLSSVINGGGGISSGSSHSQANSSNTSSAILGLTGSRTAGYNSSITQPRIYGSSLPPNKHAGAPHSDMPPLSAPPSLGPTAQQTNTGFVLQSLQSEQMQIDKDLRGVASQLSGEEKRLQGIVAERQRLQRLLSGGQQPDSGKNGTSRSRGGSRERADAPTSSENSDTDRDVNSRGSGKHRMQQQRGVSPIRSPRQSKASAVLETLRLQHTAGLEPPDFDALGIYEGGEGVGEGEGEGEGDFAGFEELEESGDSGAVGRWGLAINNTSDAGGGGKGRSQQLRQAVAENPTAPSPNKQAVNSLSSATAAATAATATAVTATAAVGSNPGVVPAAAFASSILRLKQQTEREREKRRLLSQASDTNSVLEKASDAPLTGSQEKENVSASTANSGALINYNHSDVGKTLQLFAFRKNEWETITLLDFDPSGHSTGRPMHRIEFSPGVVQWVDLRRKPVRAV